MNDEEQEDIDRYEQEFRSIMEQRFLRGDDARFVDYDKLEQEVIIEDTDEYVRDQGKFTQIFSVNWH